VQWLWRRVCADNSVLVPHPQSILTPHDPGPGRRVQYHQVLQHDPHGARANVEPHTRWDTGLHGSQCQTLQIRGHDSTEAAPSLQSIARTASRPVHSCARLQPTSGCRSTAIATVRSQSRTSHGSPLSTDAWCIAGLPQANHVLKAPFSLTIPLTIRNVTWTSQQSHRAMSVCRLQPHPTRYNDTRHTYTIHATRILDISNGMQDQHQLRGKGDESWLGW
jgi:hypothetical protein